MPETTPAAVISQTDESIATDPLPSPSVVVPVDESVVNAPVPLVVAPIETKLAAPVFVTFQFAPVIAVLSKAEPMFMVSVVVLFVPMFMAFPAVPVPMFTVFALFPVPTFTSPVVLESSVIEFPAPDVMVNAPESAIWFVVNVWEAIAVPVMKVPVPLLAILVVPPRVRLPAVIARSPVVTVSALLAVRSPADVIVPEPVAEILPDVVMASPAVRGERVVVFLCQY